jgi:hypothetical protein
MVTRDEPEGASTRIALEHRDWQQTDADRQRRQEYESGRSTVIAERLATWIRDAHVHRRQQGGGQA